MTSAAARIIGAPVPPATPLMQAGMDSLGAVELRRELAAALGALLWVKLGVQHRSHSRASSKPPS